MKISPILLKCNTKKQVIDPIGLCAPWCDSFIDTQNNYQNIENKTKMIFCWKGLDQSLNNCERSTQWTFDPLGSTLTYKTPNLDNLRNFLEANQCIDDKRCNHKNRKPCYEIPSLFCYVSYINVGYKGYFGCNYDILDWSCSPSTPLIVTWSYLQVNTYFKCLLRK